MEGGLQDGGNDLHLNGTPDGQDPDAQLNYSQDAIDQR